MACEKCGYKEQGEKEKFGRKLCKICYHFAPEREADFNLYAEEKIDWKTLDTFRKYGQSAGEQQKKGMAKEAEKGNLVVRPALGYSVQDGRLIQNEDAVKIRSLFTTFLEKEYSLNSLSKNFGLSVNGLKKVLTNRTYLGEIKFAGKLHKGPHQAIINPETFYAVQRKLKEKLSRPRKPSSNQI
jgi:lambda repressor-like predicted transcriptional regulator